MCFIVPQFLTISNHVNASAEINEITSEIKTQYGVYPIWNNSVGYWVSNFDVGDLDGDGLLEIITKMWVNDGDIVQVILDNNGSLIQLITKDNPVSSEFNFLFRDRFGSHFIINDLDGDGKDEIITSDGIYDLKGNLLVSLNSSSVSITGNINGDDVRDVVSVGHILRVFDGKTGDVLFEFNVTEAYNSMNNCTIMLSSGPTVDLDGDSIDEVLFETWVYKGDWPNWEWVIREVFAINNTGSVLWRTYVGGADSFQGIPAYRGFGWNDFIVIDLDNDNNSDVLLRSDKTYAIKGLDGSILWEKEYLFNENEVFIRDIDDDGIEEIIGTVVPFWGVKPKKIVVLSFNGEVLKELNFEYSIMMFNIVNLNEDKHIEFILISDNYLQAIDYEGNIIWKNEFNEKIWWSDVFSISDDLIYISLYEEDKIMSYSNNGDLLWEKTIDKIGRGQLRIYDILDLNDDDEKELIVLSDKVYVYNKNGTLLWSYGLGTIYDIITYDLTYNGLIDMIHMKRGKSGYYDYFIWNNGTKVINESVINSINDNMTKNDERYDWLDVIYFDLDNNGINDTIIYYVDHISVQLDLKNIWEHYFDEFDYIHWPTRPSRAQPYIKIRDINNDGSYEIFATDNKWIYAFTANGTLIWKYEGWSYRPLNYGFDVVNFGDINGGGHEEVFIPILSDQGSQLVALQTIFPPEINIPEDIIITSNRSISLEWDIPDNENEFDYFELYLNHNPIVNITDTNYTIKLNEGKSDIKIQYYDKQGYSSYDSVIVYIDTTPPSIYIDTPINGTNVESETISLTFNTYDEVSGIDRNEVRLDNNSWINLGTKNTYSFNLHEEGDHIIEIKATDILGNTKIKQIRFTKIYIDRIPPSINIIHPQNTELLESNEATIRWTATDDHSGIDHCEISLDNNAWINVGTNFTYKFTSKEEGWHTATVKAIDSFGNSKQDNVTFRLYIEIDEETKNYTFYIFGGLLVLSLSILIFIFRGHLRTLFVEPIFSSHLSETSLASRPPR